MKQHGVRIRINTGINAQAVTVETAKKSIPLMTGQSSLLPLRRKKALNAGFAKYVSIVKK